MARIKTYLRRNWKRLLVANLLGYLVQVVAICLLIALGCPTIASVAIGKAMSFLPLLNALRGR